MFKKILLAVDDSNVTKRAMNKVIDIQKKFHCSVVAFHAIGKIKFSVVGPIPECGMYSKFDPYPIFKKVLKEREKEGRRILEEIKKKFKVANLLVETRLIRAINPFEYIISIVENEDFDLVVLGLKEKLSKLKRIFKKTVTQKVIDRIPCDIFVIR